MGQAHQVGFPAVGGDAVRFELAWELPAVGMDHFTAC
jgi:hypothetical protein